MFCSKCGQENQEGSSFCNACGAALQIAPTPAPTPTAEVTLTQTARVRSSAILALIGSVSGAILTYLLICFVSENLISSALFALLILSTITIIGTLIRPNAISAKICSILTMILTVLSLPVWFLANIVTPKFFYVPTLVAMIVLTIGAIKTVIAAFAYGKK